MIMSRQDEQRPVSQRPPEQSLGLWHILPSAHFVHADPPQSTSASPWFLTISRQVGLAQVPAEQT
jgi:hypothetical protein